jgi:hypothetical protein
MPVLAEDIHAKVLKLRQIDYGYKFIQNSQRTVQNQITKKFIKQMLILNNFIKNDLLL